MTVKSACWSISADATVPEMADAVTATRGPDAVQLDQHLDGEIPHMGDRDRPTAQSSLRFSEAQGAIRQVRSSLAPRQCCPRRLLGLTAPYAERMRPAPHYVLALA